MLKTFIDVKLKESILDPQGNAVKEGLLKLGFNIENIRIGKHIEILIESNDTAEASTMVERMCERLLVNTEIETYKYYFEEV
jgi:phosphoribosylformylglycinamidine synthase subunit PurS